jgi:hypothetical protein
MDPKEAFLTPEIGGMWENDKFSLQEYSKYFFQIQILMHVTELAECDLVVWTQKGIFCHRMSYDPLFVQKICVNVFGQMKLFLTSWKPCNVIANQQVIQ